jgi:hypothetical protein
MYRLMCPSPGLSAGLQTQLGSYRLLHTNSSIVARLMRHVWRHTYEGGEESEGGGDNSFTAGLTKVVNKCAELIEWSSVLGTRVMFALVGGVCCFVRW